MKNKIYLITLAPSTHRTSEENLGILYLKSSLMKANYEVEIIDGWLNDYSVEDVFNKIKYSDNILFIGISSYMLNTKPSIELIKKLKINYPNIKIVCGGFGPTFYPEEHLRSGCDFVSRGEGEISLVNLANALKNNSGYENIKGISYIKDEQVVNNKCQDLVENLDDLPFPSRDTIETVLKNKSTVNMLTSRGCSGNCEFCSVISFFRLSNGKIWRTRSINNIVDEIEKLSQMGIEYIKMVDDSFIDGNRNEKWCYEFANEINRRNIKVKLRGQIRADKVTEDILSFLKEAGFFSFACGIENGSQSALTRMNKGATLEDNERALYLFEKYNYLVQMGFILFDRDTTIDELYENLDFLNKYKFAVMKGIFSEMYSAQGTKLNDKLKDSKLLIESDFVSNNNKYDINNYDVFKVYSALKTWHKSHSYIYDMTIDPLTAPKAIKQESMNKFYKLFLELKEKDLKIYKKILERKDTKLDELLEYIESQINNENEFYNGIYEQTQKVYVKEGLKYNAINNPFIR